MDESKLLSGLYSINRWWDGDDVPESIKKADYKRRDFHTIKKKVCNSDRPIIPIYGPRQVGKTTVSGQLIEYLLDNEVESPEQILYFSLDMASISSDMENIIEDALTLYEENVLGESFETTDKQVYVFIDEIQKAPNWPDKLKHFEGTYSNLKFVITGSISTLIDEDARETLVGRLDSYLLLPVKYIEYVGRRKILSENNELNLSRDLKKSLKKDAMGDNRSFYHTSQRVKAKLESKKPELMKAKDEYLLKGGYPGIMDKDYADVFGMLDEDLQNTLSDIKRVYGVNSEQKLLKLLEIVAYSSGNSLNIQNISEKTGMSRNTVYEYLDHLENFFLIDRSEKFSRTPLKNYNKKKFYILDPGILNTLNNTLSERTLDNSQEMGKVVQTTAYTMSKRLQFYLSDYQNAEVHFRDKNGEIDLLMASPRYEIPVEVKNGDPRGKNLKGLRNFVENSDKAEFGIALNNSDVLEKEDDGEIIHFPLWLYLFMI